MPAQRSTDLLKLCSAISTQPQQKTAAAQGHPGQVPLAAGGMLSSQCLTGQLGAAWLVTEQASAKHWHASLPVKCARAPIGAVQVSGGRGAASDCHGAQMVTEVEHDCGLHKANEGQLRTGSLPAAAKAKHLLCQINLPSWTR